jgi:hypothetical protein
LAVVTDNASPSVEVWLPTADLLTAFPAARDFAWAPDGSLFLSKQVGGPTDGRILHDELFHARLGATTLERLGVTFPTSTPNYGLFLAGTSPGGDPVVWVDEFYSGSGMMDGPPMYLVHDGRAIRLGRMRLQRSWVTWTPSGSQFAFVETGARMVTDPRAVKVCNATIACTALRTDGSQTTDPAWSPDGSRLAFVRNDASTDPNDFVHDGAPDWSTRYASRRLWIANAGRLSSAREAAWAGRGVGAPTWVSDHELVYTRADGALMLADVDAHHVQKVGSLALPDEAPPSQVYDPSDANAEVQWTDLFAVAPSS